MKNLYNKIDVDEILNRVEKLTPNTQRKWGKMNIGQMLAHLNAFIETALDSNCQERMLIGKIIGRFFKNRYVSKKQFSKNSPTSKNYTFIDQKDFEKEKSKAILTY